MSPSGFMQAEKVRGMSDTSGLGKPRPLEPQTKASQDEAAYGASDAKCSSCTHFQEPNACDKVEGEIDPGGHSKYYEPAADATTQVDDATTQVDRGY